MANSQIPSFVIRPSPFVIWLLVLLPVAALFGPVLFTDRSFAMRDAAHFYHPLFQWTAQEWGEGRVPLWNPDENCGVPVVADASSSVFYPGKLIFALPLDFTLLYKLYVMGHVVLAAAGSYLLARHWKASPFAAGAAALCYACGGNVVFQYCNVVFLVGAAWLPLALLAADRLVTSRTIRPAIELGVVLAMMILGGEPQAAYHSLLLTALYGLIMGLGKHQDLQPMGGGRWRQLRTIACLFVLSAITGFLLSAIQVLPSSEASKESERAAYRRPRNIYEAAAFVSDVRGGHLSHQDQPVQVITHGLIGPPDATTHHERAYYFSVGPWRFAELIWPNICGRMFPTHRRWLSLWPAEGRIWTPTLYMGLLPILLAAAQIRLRGGDERTRWLSWTILIFTLGSLGWYGLGWVAREFCSIVLRMDGEKFPFGPQVGGVYWLMTTLLPEYVNFRYPAKLLVVSSLAASQLAALGWDRLFAEQRARFLAVLKWLGGISGVLLVIAWGVVTFFGSLLKADAHDSSLGPFDGRGSGIDVQLAFLQTAAACGVLMWLLGKAWKEPQRSAKWQLAALLVVALDLTLANYWLVPGAPASIWRDSPTAAQLVKGDHHSRVYRSNLSGGWRPAEFGKQRSSQRMSEIAQWEAQTLFPKYGLNHGVALVESYGSIKSVHYESLLVVGRSYARKQADGSQPLPASSVLRLLGTEYLLLPETYLPGAEGKLYAEKVDADQPPATSAALWKMKTPFPRAWIVHDVKTLPPLPKRLDLDAIDARATEVLFPADPTTKERKARDLLATAVVETGDELDLTPADDEKTQPPQQESCDITLSQPTRVEIHVQLASPGLVVLNDTYAPGWVAYLRSEEEAQAVRKEVPIYRTDRIFRGVVVPEGRHVLKFEYRPTSFYRGATISLLAWLGLGLFWAIGVVRRRRAASQI